VAKKKKKRKAVKTTFIPPIDPDTNLRAEPYQCLSDAKRWHLELADARFALYWYTGFTPDKDGRLTLARIRKLSDREREVAPYDADIEINRDVWHSHDFSDADKVTLLDHELCHLRVVLDDEGFPQRDTRDRICYRIRKHDVEEFHEVAERHGPYDHGLQQFARSLMARQKPRAETPAPPPPVGPVTAALRDSPDSVAQVAAEALRRAGLRMGAEVKAGEQPNAIVFNFGNKSD
jgi:hypothetical protein